MVITAPVNADLYVCCKQGLKARRGEKGSSGFKGDLVSLILPVFCYYYSVIDEFIDQINKSVLGFVLVYRDLLGLQENKDLRGVQAQPDYLDWKDQQDQWDFLDPL